MKKFAQKNCRKMFHEAFFSEFPNSVLNFELDILLKKKTHVKFIDLKVAMISQPHQVRDILGCQDSRHGF